MSSLDIKQSENSQNPLGHKGGFSIVELTFVIVIVGTIISMIIFTTQARLDVARIFSTKERMQIIIDAIERYTETYGHLPCPALITAERADHDYGWATGSAGGDIDMGGNCVQAAEVLANSGSDIVKGMVPVRSLVPPLDPQIAVDGWGNRFTYIISENFSTIDNYAGTGSFTDSIIQLVNGADTGSGLPGDVTVGHAYLLISHGPNGHGAHVDKSPATAKDIGSAATSNDIENTDNDSKVYIQSMPIANHYDDILISKFRWQLPDILK